MTDHDAEPATEARTNAGNGEDTERTLEADIERLRGELDAIVGELDRRRHEAFDVRLQVRRHPGVVATVGAAAVVLLISGVAAWRSSRRRQQSMLVRLHNLGRAVAILSEDPERLARTLEGKPQPGTAILSAATGLAGAAARRAILGAR